MGINTIPKIGRKDHLHFMKTYFVPSNMVVAVSGDITKKQAVSGIRKRLKALPDSQAPQRRIDDPPATPPVLALIPKPGQIQSQVILALRGVKRTSMDFWKIRLLTDIFGGSDSLMYTRLRDDLGLVYSAGFFQTYKWQAGLLVGYIGCKGDQTPTSIAETIKIMDVLRNEVPAETLKLKRLEALNSFVFNVDTPAELVATYARYYMRREPLDTLEKIQEAYIGVDGQKLQTLAQEYLVPEKLQIFVVADKNIPVFRTDIEVNNLADDLKALATRIGLPYREIPLR